MQEETVTAMLSGTPRASLALSVDCSTAETSGMPTAVEETVTAVLGSTPRASPLLSVDCSAAEVSGKAMARPDGCAQQQPHASPSWSSAVARHVR